jgi:gentisate 1,2-dioxygenase
VNDIPIMDRFELEREEQYDKNNGHQEVTGEFKPDFR